MLTAVRRTVKVAVLATIVVAFLAFSVGNREFVSISLFPLPYAMEIPKFLLIIMCFGAGIFAGGLAVHLKLSKAKRVVKAERKRVVALQNEVRVLQEEYHQQKISAPIPAVPAKT